MLRLYLHSVAISMGHYAVNQFFRDPGLPQKLRRFQAVLLRVQFKINIVEKPHKAPEILLSAVAKLLCIPAHHALHGQPVKDMEGFFIIFL